MTIKDWIATLDEPIYVEIVGDDAYARNTYYLGDSNQISPMMYDLEIGRKCINLVDNCLCLVLTDASADIYRHRIAPYDV